MLRGNAVNYLVIGFDQPNSSEGTVEILDQAKKTYQDCQNRFRSLGADVVEEDDVESWAHDRLGKDFQALVSQL